MPPPPHPSPPHPSPPHPTPPHQQRRIMSRSNDPIDLCSVATYNIIIKKWQALNQRGSGQGPLSKGMISKVLI